MGVETETAEAHDVEQREASRDRLLEAISNVTREASRRRTYLPDAPRRVYRNGDMEIVTRPDGTPISFSYPDILDLDDGSLFQGRTTVNLDGSGQVTAESINPQTKKRITVETEEVDLNGWANMLNSSSQFRLVGEVKPVESTPTQRSREIPRPVLQVVIA